MDTDRVRVAAPTGLEGDASDRGPCRPQMVRRTREWNVVWQNIELARVCARQLILVVYLPKGRLRIAPAAFIGG
jgi:hypothetical protein